MMNENAFTCIGRSHGAPVVPATREEWERMRREPWLADMCRRIERGDAELKHRLPVWTPHCAEFRGNHRSVADAVRPLPRLMLDFDEKGRTDEILARLRDRSPLRVLLVEESVRRGTHVLVELPEGMSADEAQRLMAEATGFAPDKAVKDVSRCIYMVTEAHTRFVDEVLFNGKCGCEVQKENVPTPLPSREGSGGGPCLSYRGVPYSDIIDEWWLRTGGVPAEGERNVKLHRLAVNLRSICDNRRDVLMAVMPRLGLSEQEMTAIVDSACKEQPKGMSKVMKEIVESPHAESEILPPKKDEYTAGALPTGLRQSLVGVPEAMRMPVICSVMTVAGAYADGVEVEYCDGKRQRLGLMAIVVGQQASGKSVCKDVVDVWKRRMQEQDARGRQKEQEWKELRRGRKANERLPEEPKEVVREVPVTISCSTLLRRLKNAQGHTLYSFGEELDTLRKTNSAGNWSSKYDVYRLSFDNGEWGQDYNSDMAESGVVRVAYNWTILGTYGAMARCFRGDNVENGLSSRLIIAEMPDTTFSAMPHFGRRSEADEKAIEAAAERLSEIQGFVDTPRLRRAIGEWVEKKRLEAQKDIDLVKDTYRKRAAVIGFRCGVIHHLLTGNKRESRSSVAFALMMADYVLRGQMHVFGERLLKQLEDGCISTQGTTPNRTVFDQLPQTFTFHDLMRLKGNHVSASALRMIIHRWRQDEWIEKTGDRTWRKK